MLLLDTLACHTPLFIFIQSELSLCIWQVLDHLCVMMSAVCVCSWVFCFLVQMKIFIILYDTRIAFAGNMTMTCSVVCVHNMYVNCVLSSVRQFLKLYILNNTQLG